MQSCLARATLAGWILACANPQATSGPAPSATSQGFILGPNEGQRVLSHLVKVDPQLGSRRLGLGTQVARAGTGISLHMHGAEDEILYIIRGRGVGVVGRVQRELLPGSLIYIPQGAWHGVRIDEEMEIMWIVSPPHFAMHLREWQAQGGVVSEKSQAIARKHQYHESDEFLRAALHDSEWQADSRWGFIRFDPGGLVASYTTAASRGGMLELLDNSQDGLGFRGMWQEDGDKRGEFLLYYEFASDSLMHLKWGPHFERQSVLRRVR